MSHHPATVRPAPCDLSFFICEMAEAYTQSDEDEWEQTEEYSLGSDYDEQQEPELNEAEWCLEGEGWGRAKIRTLTEFLGDDEDQVMDAASVRSSWEPLLAQLNVDSMLFRMKTSKINQVSKRWTMSSSYKRSKIVDNQRPKSLRLVQVNFLWCSR